MRRVIADWWFAPVPGERLAALRILIGLYALVYLILRIPEFAGVAKYGPQHFKPVGIVQLLDAPLSPALVLVIAIATCVLLVAFIAGFAHRIVAPLAALALLWTITYRNSWGMVFHTENLMLLHVIALALAPQRTDGDSGWPIKLCAVLTVATYVLAGIAKLRIAGLDWVDGELLRNQIAVDNLRKALLGDHVAPLARMVLDHPSQLVVFCVMTLAVELGAPLALVQRRLGYLWALGAWGFHVGVVLMMNIWFPYPLVGLAFLPFLPAERVIHAAQGIAHRVRR